MNPLCPPARVMENKSSLLINQVMLSYSWPGKEKAACVAGGDNRALVELSFGLITTKTGKSFFGFFLAVQNALKFF